MKTVTVKQIQALDRMAMEKYGIPSLILMENAGRAVAEEVLKSLRNKKNPFVCVICGQGNNAGDGFVAARHLLNAGIKTKTFLIGKVNDLKHDAAVNYQILKKAGYAIVSPQKLSRADVVVDAIFGVGLNRAVGEPFKTVIETINKEAKCVVSIDIPSGLDGTTGKIYGVCVRADLTVTFSFAKEGFFKNEGPQRTGEIIVADIGIPERVSKKYWDNRQLTINY